MRPLDMFLGAMVAVLWGGNFVASKFGIAYFQPFQFTALRFLLTAILLLPFVPRLSKSQFKSLLPIAVLGSLHFSMLVVSIHQGLDIATAALVGQLGVPFACMLGAMLLKDQIGRWQVSGIVIAFIGIMIVAGTPNILHHPVGFFIALGSTLSWGLANIFIKRLENIANMQLLAWQALMMVPLIFLLSTIFDDHPWQLLAQLPPLANFSGLIYTVIGSTLFAYGIWYYLLGKYTVSQVTPFSLPTPVFGIAFGQLFFTESITLNIIIGGAITIIGVAIIVLRRPKLGVIAEAV